MKPFIRPALQILAGILVAAGLIPEGAQEAVVEHGTLVVGGLVVLWGIVAGARNRKEAKP